MVTRKFIFGLLAVAGVSALSAPAMAAPITLTGTLPDAFMDTGYISWSTSTDILTVSGTTEFVTGTSGNKVNDSAGNFSLTAHLTPVAGTSGSTEQFTIGAATLTETGKPSTDPSTLHTFFSSNSLVQFGYDTTADNFQFIFSNATGDDAVAGKNVAVNLHGLGSVIHPGSGNSAFTSGFFDSPFNNNIVVPIGTADTFNVPEPASLAVMGAAAVPLMLRRRRKA